MIKECSLLEIVPVKEEPNHQQLFENSYIRIYMAKLKPGEETKYHSHHEDTIYIAVAGGKIQTVKHTLDEGCPNVLLKKYSIMYKLKLVFDTLRRKPVELRDGFSFFMPSASKKTVHKARASADNKKDMMLLGIEIKS